jgi:hypothetical protein
MEAEAIGVDEKLLKVSASKFFANTFSNSCVLIGGSVS